MSIQWLKITMVNLLLLLFTCVFGDYLTFVLNHKISLIKALSDSLTHGAIGFLCWFHVENSLKNSILCGLLAMFVDIDHFIEAKSFKLENALKLQHRPFLHNSTIPLVLTFLVILVNFCTNKSVIFQQVKLYGSMVIVALFSHHLRDASRRGLWFGPFISSLPVPYPLYIALTIGLCLVMKIFVISESFLQSKLSSNMILEV